MALHNLVMWSLLQGTSHCIAQAVNSLHHTAECIKKGVTKAAQTMHLALCAFCEGAVPSWGMLCHITILTFPGRTGHTILLDGTILMLCRFCMLI